MMQADLLRYKDALRVRREGKVTWLFDAVRRKWLVLQPEEMVRQLLVHWLTGSCGYPEKRISLERGLLFNGLSRRYDLLVYGPDMRPFLLAECKAPRVRIDERAFFQIATYNLALEVPYLLVTNGREVYLFSVDRQQRACHPLDRPPPYPEK